MKKRVVILGLGETGLLVAVNLRADADVVGIAPKPCLVSGQDLGSRIADLDAWREHHVIEYDRYEGLRGVQHVQGRVASVDPEARLVEVTTPAGTRALPYDALVIALGVRNGFWRDADLCGQDEVDRRLREVASRFERARRVAVVGSGATGVSAAAALREQDPSREVHLFYGGELPLPAYHPRARQAVRDALVAAGVTLHPGHRAVLPAGDAADQPCEGPVSFSTGQDPWPADVVLYAVGRQRPNTEALPAAWLDPEGYVRVDDTLGVVGAPGVFAVGDCAASDPDRSSARNSGFLTVAHNLGVFLEGRGRPARYRASRHRWGSILGVRRDGMRVFAPNGASVRLPRRFVSRFLYPVVVRRLIYKGISPARQPTD